MDLISFDALRTLNIPNHTYIKPERMFAELGRIIQADGVLFPEYWQINTLVYALKARIFPSQASYLIGHDKIEMTRCFQAVAPAHVPYTLIEANTPSNADRVWQQMPLPFVAKIPRSSMGQGVFLIETPAQWRDYLQLTPVIYAQEYLDIDRDLRVVWVGDRIVGGYWRLQSWQGFYNNVAKGGTIEEGIVPVEARRLVRRLARALGIDYGGFDIAMLGSHPYVFEFNRIFGNQGLAGMQDKMNQQLLDYLYRQWHDFDPGRPRTPPVSMAG
ncbi:ATP-grasp domain-containing protein [Methylomarinum vadi]|uniref:ATP-grasp domain-containing protein n=1 Tax=Methylomarinum vadi TaxID=438855 RepID=UPI0004DEF498|nr:alpha-L-glutamate ligase [Methylomarinum vadi]